MLSNSKLMPKVLILSGQTATGKTKLAEILARKYNGELISVDSRQIYSGLNIGTGKDHHPTTTIHLVDILTPKESFSAIDFSQKAKEKIEEIIKKNKLPILVGGTGYYLHALLYFKTFQSSNIKTNILFPILNKFPAKILQKIYRLLQPEAFKKLNHSEQNNPHRLIKRILLSLSLSNKNEKQNQHEFVYDFLHIHLTATKAHIENNIDQRISSRLKAGLLQEIENLEKKYSWTAPGLATIAYREFKPFFTETDTLASCINEWAKNEKHYAKRQKVYFKKFFPNRCEFDVGKINSQKNILSIIGQWYNK